MSRALDVLRSAAGLALIGAALLWWLSTLLLFLGRMAGEGAKFAAVMVASRALGSLGLHRAALRVCRAERDRVATKMAAVRVRRGW